LLSFAKFHVKHTFYRRSISSVVVLNFHISQGSVAVWFRWGGNLYDNT